MLYTHIINILSTEQRKKKFDYLNFSNNTNITLVENFK